MLIPPSLDAASTVPLYRQLYEHVRFLIQSGDLPYGERLPPTRDWAAQLGLNRATVSSAYDLLEADGLIKAHVGRGSFVAAGREESAAPTPISFATSRPAEHLFPVDAFQETCREVLASPTLSSVLQLGSPAGYSPLRDYLLEEARSQDELRPGDDVTIVSGCQQSLDLLQRLYAAPGDTVVVEDPVYPGLKNVFERAGVRLLGVPVGPEGMEVEAVRRVLVRERPRLLLVTPSFQNPTGVTLPLESRRELLRLAREAGVLVVENDLYAQLRYDGDALPTLKRLDEDGNVVLVRSFSKVAFPGLRVGWLVAPRSVTSRIAEAKQWCDLHTDQLAQAVLLRFAESGRLGRHLERIRTAGRDRLAAVLQSLDAEMPAGTEWTRPCGGMNLWLRLAGAVDAGDLLPRAEQAGVSYLPGRHFAVGRPEPGGLRLSFAGLTPAQIRQGVALLGAVVKNELGRPADAFRREPAPAMV